MAIDVAVAEHVADRPPNPSNHKPWPLTFVSACLDPLTPASWRSSLGAQARAFATQRLSSLALGGVGVALMRDVVTAKHIDAHTAIAVTRVTVTSARSVPPATVQLMEPVAHGGSALSSVCIASEIEADVAAAGFHGHVDPAWWTALSSESRAVAGCSAPLCDAGASNDTVVTVSLTVSLTDVRELTVALSSRGLAAENDDAVELFWARHAVGDTRLCFELCHDSAHLSAAPHVACVALSALTGRGREGGASVRSDDDVAVTVGAVDVALPSAWVQSAVAASRDSSDLSAAALLAWMQAVGVPVMPATVVAVLK